MELKVGDKGAHVLELQNKLKVTATGEFDRETELAVLSLQLDNGLPAHGMVTQIEWDMLGCKVVETKVAYKQTAKDGDGDGLVQDNTPFERPTKNTNDK